MALRKISSNNTAADASTYVGDKGELFFDPNYPQLKASDGQTPGGISVGDSNIQPVAGATRTLALEDAAKLVVVSSAGSTLTVPTNAAAAFPVGTLISIATLDVSATISASGGVSMYNASVGANAATYTVAARSLASIIKISTNLWYISGSNLA